MARCYWCSPLLSIIAPGNPSDEAALSYRGQFCSHHLLRYLSLTKETALRYPRAADLIHYGSTVAPSQPLQIRASSGLEMVFRSPAPPLPRLNPVDDAALYGQTMSSSVEGFVQLLAGFSFNFYSADVAAKSGTTRISDSPSPL